MSDHFTETIRIFTAIDSIWAQNRVLLATHKSQSHRQHFVAIWKKSFSCFRLVSGKFCVFCIFYCYFKFVSLYIAGFVSPQCQKLSEASLKKRQRTSKERKRGSRYANRVCDLYDTIGDHLISSPCSPVWATTRHNRRRKRSRRMVTDVDNCKKEPVDVVQIGIETFQSSW